MTTNNVHPAIPAMSAIASETVRHYMTDFTRHDIAALTEADAGDQFVWVPYKRGTHLVWLGHDASDTADLLESILHNFGGTPYRWDGLCLFELSWPELFTALKEAA